MSNKNPVPFKGGHQTGRKAGWVIRKMQELDKSEARHEAVLAKIYTEKARLLAVYPKELESYTPDNSTDAEHRDKDVIMTLFLKLGNIAQKYHGDVDIQELLYKRSLGSFETLNAGWD